MQDEPCLQGGGCTGQSPECKAISDSGTARPPPQDSAEVLGFEGSPARDTCSTTASLPSWPLAMAMMVVLVLRRRALWGLLLLVALPAHAQDVRPWIQLDGGPMPGFIEPAPAPPWSLRSAVALNHAAHPVRERTNQGSRDFVTSLDSLEVAGSLQVRNWFRVGVNLPVAQAAFATGSPIAQLGRPTFFLIREANARLAMIIQALVFDEGVPWVTGPSFGFSLVTKQPVGNLIFLGRMGFRGLFLGRSVGSVAWGHRIESALGLRTQGSLAVGAQLVGSAPMTLFFSPPRGAWPLEALASGHMTLSPRLHLDAVGGIGLTTGLGSPRWRVGIVFRYARPSRDDDRDRIINAFDRCDEVPEDKDRFQDRDGCPEPDNDQDGFLDAQDACPNDPETENGFRDEDGCPDLLAPLLVRVNRDPEQRIEQVYIGIDDQGSWQLDIARRVEVAPGKHRVEVRAAGHHPFVRSVFVPDKGRTVEVRLRPIREVSCRIAVISETGAPLTAAWEWGESQTIEPEGSQLLLPDGTHEGPLRAEGHLEAWQTLHADPSKPCQATWVLTPGEPIDPIGFVVDSADLDDNSGPALDALAAWLTEHTEVLLLRVTGHADPPGTPAYNLRLSKNRANAVVEALVTRGIDATRLEALGSGESRQRLVIGEHVSVQNTGAPLRQVDLQVIVWEETARPTPPSSSNDRSATRNGDASK
ncbi:MAG: OmpA family protein [Myxococcota bacterium]